MPSSAVAARAANVWIEGQHNPLGIDVPAPAFPWVITAPARGAESGRYRFFVARARQP